MHGVATSSIYSVSFGQHVINFSLKYSNRKTLAISVLPDLSVSVTAPLGKDIAAIKTKVRHRAAWILRQQEHFKKFLPSTPPRRFVSGETHYYLGKQYRLKVIQAEKEVVKLKGGLISVWARNRKDSGRIKELVNHWLLTHAKIRFQQSLAKCWEKFRKYKVARPELRVRRMVRRWGSFNPRGVVYLNPELIKAPSHCIDYVVTHELCHLRYSDHSKSFYHLLSRVMPDWREHKARLERVEIAS